MPSLKAMAKEAKIKKSAAPKKVNKKASPQATNLSTEFVQDSDLEQDEESDGDSSSDEGESIPENTTLTLSKSNSMLAAPVTDDTSSSGSEDENSEASSISSEDEDEEPSKVAKNLLIGSTYAKAQSSKQSSTKMVSFKESSPYKPPSGFELASLEEEIPRASQLFEKSNLEGKQIWYLTAPASVPISSIQNTTLAEISNGNAILSHNGNDYGFTQSSAEDITYIKVMVPKISDESYHAGHKTIDRILHLQQIVKLPSVYDANGKEASSSSTARPTVPAKKPIRQQPPGLRMRFRPFGFGSGNTGVIGSSSSSADGSDAESTSDEEMGDTPPQFRQPASLEAEQSVTSSDGSDDSSSSSDAEMTEAPPLASKPTMKTQSPYKVAEEEAK